MLTSTFGDCLTRLEMAALTFPTSFCGKKTIVLGLLALRLLTLRTSDWFCKIKS